MTTASCWRCVTATVFALSASGLRRPPRADDGRCGYRHRDRCPAWAQDTRVASFFEAPIAAQVEQMRLGERLLANLQRLATATTPIVDVSSARRRQLERELEDLARQHAHRRVTTEAYLPEHERLTALIDAIRPVTGTSPIVDPDIAIAWLRDTKELWKEMDEEGRRELIAALCERITLRMWRARRGTDTGPPPTKCLSEVAEPGSSWHGPLDRAMSRRQVRSAVTTRRRRPDPATSQRDRRRRRDLAPSFGGTAPIRKAPPVSRRGHFTLSLWSGRLDLNQRPLDPQFAARTRGSAYSRTNRTGLDPRGRMR
jgi:hypothetical protein